MKVLSPYAYLIERSLDCLTTASRTICTNYIMNLLIPHLGSVFRQGFFITREALAGEIGISAVKFHDQVSLFYAAII